MTLRELVRLGGLTVAAVALSVVVALGLGHAQAGLSLAQDAEGAIAIDCSSELDGIQTECDYPSDATFNVQVHVTEAPAVGYVTYQVKIRWTDGTLNFQAAGDAMDENLWEACVDGFAQIFDNRTLDEPDPSFLYSCVPFPVLETAATYTGPLAQFSFQCTADTAGTLEFVPRLIDGERDPQTGTYFAIRDEEDPTLAVELDPETLSGATVNCGVEPPPAATTEPTPPTGLPVTGSAGSIDAAGGPDGGLWAVIGGLLAAAAAGLIVFGWRYARSR